MAVSPPTWRQPTDDLSLQKYGCADLCLSVSHVLFEALENTGSHGGSATSRQCGTEEMMQPCPLYLHRISLVGQWAPDRANCLSSAHIDPS